MAKKNNSDKYSEVIQSLENIFSFLHPVPFRTGLVRLLAENVKSLLLWTGIQLFQSPGTLTC